MSKPSSLRTIFRLLFEHAARSVDPSTHNAALLEPAKRYMVPGVPLSLLTCNQFPDGLAVTPERLTDRDTKLGYMDHAETGAIHLAARRGITTEGAILYCLWAPCQMCARAIIRSGISTLVVYGPLMKMTPPRWAAAVTKGLEMLDEAQVAWRQFVEPLGGDLPHRFNGELWYP